MYHLPIMPKKDFLTPGELATRATVSPDVVNCFFQNFEEIARDMPASNIFNYDGNKPDG